MVNLSDLLKQIKHANDMEGLIRMVEDMLVETNDDKKIELNIDINSRMFIDQLRLKINDFLQTDKRGVNLPPMPAQSEHLASMGQMAAAVSHELRNPLTGIKVACDYLIKKMENDDAGKLKIIKNIRAEASYADSIITNVLDFAKISKPQFESTALGIIVDESLLSVASQGVFQRIKVIKEIAEDLPNVLCDRGQIKQVLTNLFINASEAMPGGGTLKVKLFSDRSTITIVIEDSGTGIGQENLQKIFNPFYSTKIKGIGLGLTIVKEIIDNHKGQIDATSFLGKGTVFTIKLPAEKKMPVEQNQKTDTTINKSKVNILIVDDEDIICDTIAAILEDEGYHVQVAGDGEKAIEEVKKRCPDIIFMDIRLPGINGVAAFEEIKKIYPDVLVMMMTAFSVEDLVQHALDLGAQGCLYKPFDMKELLDKIRELTLKI
ncbi:MAG: response regulator [Candidatus Omnitrophota bacterium]